MKPLPCHAGPFAILLVEDEPRILEFLDQLLQLDRHTVGLAASAEAALVLFKSRKWDVVFTDLDLPGLNGGILARQIKTLSPETPVVMLTGYRDAAALANVDLLIHKPFTRASIAAAISYAMKLAAPAAA